MLQVSFQDACVLTGKLRADAAITAADATPDWTKLKVNLQETSLNSRIIRYVRDNLQVIGMQKLHTTTMCAESENVCRFCDV